MIYFPKNIGVKLDTTNFTAQKLVDLFLSVAHEIEQHKAIKISNRLSKWHHLNIIREQTSYIIYK